MPIAAADPSSKSWRASKQQALLFFWQHASSLLNLQTPLPSCGHATTQLLTPRQGCLTEDHPWCGSQKPVPPYRNPTPALGRLKIPWGSPERIIDPNKIGYSSPSCPQIGVFNTRCFSVTAAAPKRAAILLSFRQAHITPLLLTPT